MDGSAELRRAISGARRRRRRQGIVGAAMAALVLPAGADPERVRADLNELFRERGWDIEVRATSGPAEFADMLVSETAIRRDVEPALPFTRSITVDATTSEVRVVVPGEAGEPFFLLGPADEELCSLVGTSGVEAAAVLAGGQDVVRWQDLSGAPTDVDDRPVVRSSKSASGRRSAFSTRTPHPSPASELHQLVKRVGVVRRVQPLSQAML
ncbi:MAG: hypothetical protein P8N02_11200 [Actinomycetota bacterium]|nr:hypothetical protein [Actinomycetota bacterium]